VSAAPLTGLPPLEPASAQLLILGSMPGAASLHAQQYYAHPRNLFWPFMAAVFGLAPEQPYSQRVQQLLARNIAVWDVLQHCERPGSLDSAIVRSSETANDFPAFLRRHPNLRAIALNGRAAQAAFQRHVLKPHGAQFQHLELLLLPSTSPANAGLTVAAKLAQWARLAAYHASI